ncbi:MAG: CidA/LrgA family protein [Lachnotalea sp.]
MKFMKEFGIILTVTFLGEVLKYLIPLPIPASIYGLILMLVALKTKIIPLEFVQKTGRFLIEIMPLMFIPAAVGLIDSWDTLKSIFIPIIIITIISTIMVIAVAGRVTQLMIRLEARKK